jgi:hypothetical protein
MLVSLLAFAMIQQQACPITVGVARDGTIFFDRLNSWKKTNQGALSSVLHAGCYCSDDCPHPITSVKLAVAPDAPRATVDSVFSILGKEGWTPAKINIITWSDDPRKPH